MDREGFLYINCVRNHYKAVVGEHFSIAYYLQYLQAALSYYFIYSVISPWFYFIYLSIHYNAVKNSFN